jgi:pimeloyl-ACP methyl ester carboxylesterase
VFSTVTLGDGRSLEYADLGDPAGRPLLYLPGTPAAAGQGAVLAGAAGANGVRLIAVSRPGYAASTSSPPSLLGTAADVVELADLLGLDRFDVAGGSGGGPFALALGAVAPDRVGSIHALGCPASYAEVSPEDLEDDDRRALALLSDGDAAGAAAILTSWSEREFASLQGLTPAEFHVELEKTAPPGENWFDAHPDLVPAFEADWQRSITTYDGFVRDNLCWLGPWDLDLATVGTHVRLCYGENDQMVPLAHGTWLHERLPDSELRVVPGGHGDVVFGAATKLLATLG